LNNSSLVLFIRQSLAAGILVLLYSHAASATEWLVEGKVVALSDGDTITVLDENKKDHIVRIAGIDAPEKKQPYGNASRENLAKLVFNKFVEVRCYKRDRYGREVCRVYEGQRDIGLEQVRGNGVALQGVHARTDSARAVGVSGRRGGG
jgi:endonuclease YncB( thermonuclease family)